MNGARISGDLLPYVADVIAVLKTIPESGEVGGGRFHVTDVVIAWSDGHSHEPVGHVVPDDFDGYDFEVPGGAS